MRTQSCELRGIADTVMGVKRQCGHSHESQRVPIFSQSPSLQRSPSRCLCIASRVCPYSSCLQPSLHDYLLQIHSVPSRNAAKVRCRQARECGCKSVDELCHCCGDPSIICLVFFAGITFRRHKLFSHLPS